VSEEREVGVGFPVKGIDATCEYGRQPADTTPGAANVRSFDHAGRARGGSRAGLSKYVPETVVGDFPIQHLALLVDPQTPALSAEAATPGGIPDPSSNNLRTRNFGRVIRPGGSGRQPNVNDPTSGMASIAFVQAKRVQNGVTGAPFTVTLDAPPSLNNLLVVFVRTNKAGAAEELVDTVTNDALNTFAQVGGGGSTSNVTNDPGSGVETTSLSAWYRVANAGAADQDVRVTNGGSGAIYEVIVLEFSAAATGGPVSEFDKAFSDTDVSLFEVPGLALNGTAGQAVVAAFTLLNTSGTPAVGYTSPVAGNFKAIYRTGLSGAGPEDPSVTPLVDRPFAGIALALTR
jgi:hypothetical protein